MEVKRNDLHKQKTVSRIWASHGGEFEHGWVCVCVLW